MICFSVQKIATLKNMKTNLLCSYLLFIITATAFCQNYYPIPESNVTWQRYQFFTSIPCISNGDYINYFDGDTSVGNISYLKVFEEGMNVTWCTNNGVMDTSIFAKHYLGAFRQDVTAQKAFFIAEGDLNESLLYDFTLETGDTLPYNMIASEVAVIEKTDSVIVDGTYRKRMLFLQAYNACGGDTIAIIEGIGNTRGFIYPTMFPCSFYTVLTCVSINGVQIFGDADSCFKEGELGNVSAVPLLSNSNVFTAGYLSEGSVVIHFNQENYGEASLAIFNTLGQKIRQYNPTASGDIVIAKGTFSPGMYEVVAVINGRNTAVKKVIFR
jgi:hypothetical protein